MYRPGQMIAACRQRPATVREDLASSQLTVLDMPNMPRTDYAMHVIYRRDTSPGPAAAWLIKRLRG